MNKIVAAALVVCMALASGARAHVVVTDSTQTVGLVYHVMPDDDPIAGQPSQLFFDVQDQEALPEVTSAKLVVSKGDDEASVPVTVSSKTLSAEHTFAEQGMYKLELTVMSGSDTYTFTTQQAVSAGASEQATTPANNSWAYIVGAIAFLGLTLGGVLILKRQTIKS